MDILKRIEELQDLFDEDEVTTADNINRPEPKQSVKEIDIKILLVGFGSLFGLLAGIILQGLRKRLLRSIRTMPTDLLVSRAGGLIIGLFIANLNLAPILLLPLPKELIIANITKYKTTYFYKGDP